jgi:methylated-DNA-[protein]-cysteine S-methyltransferase
MKRAFHPLPLYYDIVDSFLGPILLVQSGPGIREIHFLKGDQTTLSDVLGKRSPSLLKPVRVEILDYLNGRRTSFSLRAETQGSPFQKKVWEALKTIPYGATRSYQEIAIQIGKPKAARAVGLACRRNPLPIIIPCHRVIGKNGDLTGYAGGLRIKEKLLTLESKKGSIHDA